MSVDPELVAATRDRLIGFSGVAGVQPITIAMKALGFVNPSLYRWVRGEKSRIRPVTLARINRWMDENPDYRGPRARRRL